MSGSVMGEREFIIREVWSSNLKEEMANIALILDKYNYVAMDTEFPGVIVRPMGNFRSKSDYNYQTLKHNVDMLKIIQLGLAFSDADGNSPEGCACWQFNFEFNLEKDPYAQDSIDLLTSCGLQFAEHEARGIHVDDFGALLMESGLVLNEDLHWISFHSFYDFGYLLKILTCTDLPTAQPAMEPKTHLTSILQLLDLENSTTSLQEFFDLIHMYFPNLLDMKHLELVTDSIHGGLNKLGKLYNVKRYGQTHQAGSDSLLTLHVFFAMQSVTFKGKIDEKHFGIIYGLGQ